MLRGKTQYAYTKYYGNCVFKVSSRVAHALLAALRALSVCLVSISLVPSPFCTSACAHPHNRMRVRRRVWGNGWPSHGQKLECENGARMQLVRIMSVH